MLYNDEIHFIIIFLFSQFQLVWLGYICSHIHFNQLINLIGCCQNCWCWNKWFDESLGWFCRYCYAWFKLNINAVILVRIFLSLALCLNSKKVFCKIQNHAFFNALIPRLSIFINLLQVCLSCDSSSSIL